MTEGFIISDVFVTLTIVKLAVWLLAVDEVEAVGNTHTHVAHLEVEPLVVMIAVDVWIQHKIILIPGKNITGDTVHIKS